MLPEFEAAGGIRLQIHQQFGLWIVSTRGDLIHFRLKYVKDGKVEKETMIAQFTILHDQLITKNWIKHIWQHFRYVNWNDFMNAWNCALELIDYEMGDEMRFYEM